MTNAGDVRTLLDVDAMATHLGAIPVLASGAARMAALALDRIWVKPGRHVHASYCVTLDRDGAAIDTYAVAALAASSEAARAIERRALDPSITVAPHGAPASWDVRQATARLEHPPALLQLFPWDYRLPTLPHALTARAVNDELKGTGVHEARVVGYWPGIRCQIRYECAGRLPALYGKVFTDADGPRDAARVLTMLADRVVDAGFVTPRLHACLPSLRLLLTEELPGRSLLTTLGGAETEKGLGRVATMLAAFHGLDLPEITRHFTAVDDLAIVRSWVSLVADVFPDLAAGAAAALAVLERARPERSSTEPALVHRDFYDKQILLGPDSLAILDFDTMCLGDGEIDAGNFCAHLTLRALQEPSQDWDPEAAAQGFLDAYRTARPRTDPTRVAWYRASALLRLACVYALRPWWRSLAPLLVDASRRAVEA